VQYLGHELDHHTTSSVWLLVVLQFAWDLWMEENVAKNEVYVNMLAKSHAIDA